jgi:hypothetical protein
MGWDGIREVEKGVCMARLFNPWIWLRGAAEAAQGAHGESDKSYIPWSLGRNGCAQLRLREMSWTDLIEYLYK